MKLSMLTLFQLAGPDWLALIGLFAGWTTYAWFATRLAISRASILGATNRERRRWMLRTTFRDNRVVDGMVVQNLSSSPSFFASTTILIIGGLLAVLGTANRAEELARELPVAPTTAGVFDFKLVLLLGIFVYAFFRFSWSIRQYSFGALLVAAAPMCAEPWSQAEREAFADRAGGVMALAAETFNDGLRAYYFSFAALAWLFSPWACLAATAGVVWVLYRREFHSEVLRLLAPESAITEKPPA